MLRCTLVGIDGGLDSESAFDLALRWSGPDDARVIGLAVVDQPDVRISDEVRAGSRQRDPGGVSPNREARARLEGAIARLAPRARNAGTRFLPEIEVGDPIRRLVEASHRADLVLLGRRPQIRVDGVEVVDDDGSCEGVLEALVRQIPRPVVVVPSGFRTGRSVVVATDGGRASACAVHSLVFCGLARGLTVHVISLAAEIADASHHAGRTVDFLAFHGVKAEPHPIASTDRPARVILSELRALDPALLVVGAYESVSHADSILGSNTRELIRESPVPVLIDR